jgi:methylase of polypeptide subunit release factors
MKKTKWILGLSFVLSFFSTFALALNNQEKVESAFKNLERNHADQAVYEINVMNEPFFASKDVFSPKYFKSTEMLTSNFPFRKNEKFLEIGCGVGVAAIIAAKHYQNHVVAVDINPHAVELTTENATKHGVQKLVDVRQSNVFSSVKPTEKFDTIYWDLPYVFTEAKEDKNLTMLQRSVSDPGYRNIEAFLSNAGNHISKNGRIIVGFGSNGDLERFTALVQKHHYQMKKIYEGFNPYREGITYQLYELTA